MLMFVNRYVQPRLSMQDGQRTRAGRFGHVRRWIVPLMRRQVCTIAFSVLFAATLAAGVAHGGSPGAIGAETLSSREIGHIFVVGKGQGNKTIERFDAAAGQKIRLVGFGSMTLDQLRTKLKPAGADVLLDLGEGQELRIAAAGIEIISSIQIQLDRSGLVPTFSDEFDALSLDLEENGAQSKGTWRTNFGYGGPSSLDSRTLVNNGELQIYVDRLFAGTAKAGLNLDPFRIVDGKLEIVAEPLKEDLRQFAWGRTYSSGLLTTKGSFSQQYGVFEIRTRIPHGKGLWPAFWLLPTDNSWPPEVDILEILGDNPKKLYVSWHSNAGGTHTSETKPIDVADASAEFHTYSVEWTKDAINWYFDDIEVATKSTPQDFHRPMYMLVNLAVGGGWPGSPDASTRFPATYSIDWIRAYARKGLQ
jgi:beta-glucanase (GH16 family)